jgi:hypothetical protein
MKYKYIVSVFPEKTLEFTSRWDRSRVVSIAKDAARHWWNCFEGCEDSWPLTFMLIDCNDNELGVFEISYDYDPHFKVKKQTS